MFMTTAAIANERTKEISLVAKPRTAERSQATGLLSIEPYRARARGALAAASTHASANLGPTSGARATAPPTARV